MLNAVPTKKGAGLELIGHPDDFQSLHETLHSLCEAAPGGLDQHEHALSVAYEIRKAFEGQRGVIETELGMLCSTPFIWPHILFYAGYFRQLAGQCPTTKGDQANLYALEDCIESALIEYDAKTGMELAKAYLSVGAVSQNYFIQFIEDVCFEFLFGGSSGKMRFRRLPKLLKSMSEFSLDYQAYAQMLEKEAKRLDCSPHELSDSRDWPDIDW